MIYRDSCIFTVCTASYTYGGRDTLCPLEYMGSTCRKRLKFTLLHLINFQKMQAKIIYNENFTEFSPNPEVISSVFFCLFYILFSYRSPAVISIGNLITTQFLKESCSYIEIKLLCLIHVFRRISILAPIKHQAPVRNPENCKKFALFKYYSMQRLLSFSLDIGCVTSSSL